MAQKGPKYPHRLFGFKGIVDVCSPHPRNMIGNDDSNQANKEVAGEKIQLSTNDIAEPIEKEPSTVANHTDDFSFKENTLSTMSMTSFVTR